MNDTQSTVTLIINGEQAKTSLKEVTVAVNATRAELAKMHAEDNPALYEQKIRELGRLRDAQAAMNEEIRSGSKAAKDFNSVFKEFSETMGGVREVLESLGLGILIEEFVSMGKELLNIAVKASGVENAFSKIGYTGGVIEKLRASSRGLIADFDLEKLEIKANNANIPLDRMGILLQFASQRARDTGEDVTALTNKLIEGLGRGTPKALAGLGISVVEVKEEFRKTGDMVDAVTNIIKRDMLASGQDVENFGDVVLKQGTKLENLKDKLASFWAKLFKPELADPEEIADRTGKELYRVVQDNFNHLEKLKDDQLKTAQAALAKRAEIYKAAYQKAQDELATARAEAQKKDGDQAVHHDFSEEIEKVKHLAEIYQGIRNASTALNTEKNRRDNKMHDGSVDDLDQQIAKLKVLQNEISTTAEQWKAYQVQIEALQKKREVITGKSTPAEKKAESEKEAAAKHYAELMKQLELFDAKELAETKNKNEKELDEIRIKYEQEKADLEKFLNEKGRTSKQTESVLEKLAQLEIDKNAEVGNKILQQRKDLADKIADYNNKLAGKIETARQKEDDETNKHYDELLKQGYDAAQVEEGRQKALHQSELNEEQRFQDELKKIRKGYDDAKPGAEGEGTPAQQKQKNLDNAKEKEELLKKEFGKEKQETKEFQDAVTKIYATAAEKNAAIDQQEHIKTVDKEVAYAQKGVEILFTITNRSRDNSYNLQLQRLEKQRNAELSNVNLTESGRQAIQAKFDAQAAEVKKKQFEANKAAAIEQALISGALAIMKLTVDPGYPESIPLIIAQGIETGVQVASIASQPTPEFGDGGTIDIDGPSHGAGGIPLINGRTGQPVANVEGGETVAVFSKAATRNNRSIIAQLLHSSMHQNGAAVDVGNINTGIRIDKGSYVPQFTNQVSTGSSRGSSGGSTGTDMAETNRLLAAVHAKLDELGNRPIEFNNRAFEIYQQQVAATRNAANGK